MSSQRLRIRSLLSRSRPLRNRCRSRTDICLRLKSAFFSVIVLLFLAFSKPENFIFILLSECLVQSICSIKEFIMSQWLLKSSKLFKQRLKYCSHASRKSFVVCIIVLDLSIFILIQNFKDRIKLIQLRLLNNLFRSFVHLGPHICNLLNLLNF